MKNELDYGKVKVTVHNSPNQQLLEKACINFYKMLEQEKRHLQPTKQTSANE